ncbi:hypothetical protein B4135_1328 [Caldibacillus debilis]|uniref:Uncharacterized protein n=1 Tax=Caldibacillus debilis TaxID=301148 RepID=A0A150MD04_9BACI|nr:hypothetical protein B4135_1328 [Caldibacillus debilis]
MIKVTYTKAECEIFVKKTKFFVSSPKRVPAGIKFSGNETLSFHFNG